MQQQSGRGVEHLELDFRHSEGEFLAQPGIAAVTPFPIACPRRGFNLSQRMLAAESVGTQ
jgi:hypothetical protein